MTRHGRATPLTWKTVRKSNLAGRRNDFENEIIERLHGAIPADVAVTLLADRGFGDQKFYALLESLGWDYVIRFRGAILVEDEPERRSRRRAGCRSRAAQRRSILRG